MGWYLLNARDLPWRRTRDPYRIWISEVMLQQTQVATVLPYYKRWLAELPTIAALASAPDEKLLKLWAGLGYYSRVRNLKSAAQVIMGEHKGVFPRDFEAVLDLPGIGRYTAGAICSIAFGQPRPILDGNVARVLSRVFTVKGDPREKSTAARLWDLAERLVSGAAAMQPGRSAPSNRTQCGSFNEALMELGALVCLPQAPRCDICPISTHCRARLRNAVNRFPQKAARSIATRRRLVVFVVRQGDAILTRQRPRGVPNAGFWELPFVEALKGESGEILFCKVTPDGGWGLKPIGRVTHTIMSSRFDVEAFEARKTSVNATTGHRNKCSGLGAFRRIRFEDLDSVPLSTISRKVLGLLRKTAQGRTSRKKTIEARRHEENG